MIEYIKHRWSDAITHFEDVTWQLGYKSLQTAEQNIKGDQIIERLV